MTQTVLLGDICHYVTEKIAVGEVALQDYVSTENLIADKKGLSLATNLPQVGKVTKYQAGDVLVSNIRPYFKKIWLANREGGASNDVLVFRPKTEDVANRYLFYILANDKFFDYSTASSSGSKMPRGDKAQIMKYPVHLPNLETQKKIADILGTIDEKIELNQRMNETLEQMGQALFRHYFIDNPEAEKWEEKSIYDFSDVIYGAPFSSKLFNENNEGYPLIRIRDLKTQKPGYWTTEKHPKGTLITAGDIVVGMDAEFRPHIWSADDAWLNQRVCQFVPKQDVPKLFLLESIRPWLDFYERGKIGTTVIHLGKSDIDKFNIKKPPVDIMRQFSDIADPI